MKTVYTKNQPVKTYFTQREANLNIAHQMVVRDQVPFSWSCNLDESGFVKEVVMHPTSYKILPYFLNVDSRTLEDMDGQVLMEDVDLENLVDSYYECL